METESKKQRRPNPRERAFPLSVVTFFYTIPTFLEGFSKDLQESDLTETLDEHKSGRLGDKIERHWKDEEERASKKGRKPSLHRVIMRTFGLEFLFYGLVLAISEAIRLNQPLFIGNLIVYFMQKNVTNETQETEVVQPVVLGRLISFYSPGQSEIGVEDAYWYAGGVVLCSLVNILCSHPYMMAVLHLGMKVRVACCSLIYRKALRLSKTALGETTAGQVVNLLSNDVNRFDVAVLFAHQLWIGPIETVVCTYFMYLQVGYSAVIGVLVLIVFVPMQIYLGKRISMLRLKTALRTDERVRLMNEIISGIQVIKMYAWEKSFAKLVGLARKHEIKSIRKTSFMRGILLSFIVYSTRSAIFISILSYVLFGNFITAEKVFVLTSFYNILRQTMTVFFPQGISQVAEARVSIGRLNKFMTYDETIVANQRRDKRWAEHAEEGGAGEGRGPGKEEGSSTNGKAGGVAPDGGWEESGVKLADGTARWGEASAENTLTDVSVEVSSGQLLAVIGPVGGGKSSLLHVILKELPLIGGRLKVKGEISYASQEPWLFAGTVRQNILFGLPMDKERYRLVVKTCALSRDLTLLPYGDKTVVGERGVSLSGGQRARINLARAVYKQADIYLLDDPLSAVDTHVGKELFERCVTGLLRDKAVILVTHQLQYLRECKRVVYLEDGMARTGSFRELQESGLDFARLLSGEREARDGPDKFPALDHQSLKRQMSMRSINSVEVEAPLVEEQRSVGSVGAKVYGAYFGAGGNCCAVFTVFALFVSAQLFASAADYFITYWVNLEEEDHKDELLSSHNITTTTTTTVPPLINFTRGIFNGMNLASTLNLTQSPSNLTQSPQNDTIADVDFWHFERQTSIYIYTGIICALVLVTLTRTFAFVSLCMRSSTRLHDKMFSSISRATMRFFNTNSSGRILNRFSKDIGAVDELLPAALLDCLQIGLTLLGIIVVVGCVSPWLMLPTFLIGCVFYLLRGFYLRTSRNVKRLEGITRSPVFSHLNATLLGLTTIRAFGAEEVLTREFDSHQDLHSSAWFSFISTSRAFGYWLDMVCIVYIGLVTFSFFLIGNDHLGGDVGLAITQAIGLTGMFQWGMRQSTELENQMTSVERVLEYDRVEHERRLDTPPELAPRPTWPEFGRVRFEHVYLRYSPAEAPVLVDLDFEVSPKEKVGIVGRTGAGKSSLINALFQLAETMGRIEVDDVEIGRLGLHDLRSRISIIPQEPVLFSGSMRKNLDPFDDYTDADLWRALSDVELHDVVSDLASGLQSKISEGGSNFSVGQRQLICLARAILRNNRVLVLDEATANVDPKTDALIQTTIRRKFAECTVLTIAHRLNTVMDSDKVLVMDAGAVKEFDRPFALLQNQNGVFYGMVQQTGRDMAEALYKMAERSYNNMATA